VLAVGATELLALGEEAVLQPGESELIEVARAVDHLPAVELAADHGVLVRVRVPTESRRALVARRRPERQRFERAGRAVVGRAGDVADDHVGTDRSLAARLSRSTRRQRPGTGGHREKPECTFRCLDHLFLTLDRFGSRAPVEPGNYK